MTKNASGNRRQTLHPDEHEAWCHRREHAQLVRDGFDDDPGCVSKLVGPDRGWWHAEHHGDAPTFFLDGVPGNVDLDEDTVRGLATIVADPARAAELAEVLASALHALDGGAL